MCAEGPVLQVARSQCDESDAAHATYRTRVLLAADHHELLIRVRSILEADFDVIGSVENGYELLAQAEALQPDVVIVDISMPLMNGIDAVRKLVESASTAKFIFLTIHEDPAFVSTCFAAGAMAYVVKARIPFDLIIAIREVLMGRQFASPHLRY
jgi:DNA-binding NarL/FixJ family response regulator